VPPAAAANSLKANELRKDSLFLSIRSKMVDLPSFSGLAHGVTPNPVRIRQLIAQLLYLLSRLSSDPCRKRSQNRKLAKFG
jgi:hypothetical protein